MRTLHYIVSFFPHDRGASHSALRLARGLRDRGIDVEFLVEDQGPEWRKGGQYEGFPVLSLPLTHPGKRRKLSGFIQLYRYLHRLRGRIDLVHVHGGPYMNLLLAWLAGRWLKCPTLMKITLDGWDTPDGVAKDRHGKWALALYRKLNAVVAMTSGQAETCRAWKIPGIIDVIPNSVDVQKFHPVNDEQKRELRRTLHLPADKPVMVYAGYLGFVKGTDILFQVWNQLRATIPDLQLLLAGNYMGTQNMSMSLDEFLKQQGLPPEWATDPAVHQTGKLDDLSRHLQCADLFVFPSRQEGFGTVQIEAMACGLPCVVNDLKGVSCDIFPDASCGIRIRNNQVSDFVEACSLLLSDKRRREQMGETARARAVRVFSVGTVAERYAALYEQVRANFYSSQA